MRYNLKSVKIVLFCTTNTTTNANEIKALTRVESEIQQYPLALIRVALVFKDQLLFKTTLHHDALS